MTTLANPPRSASFHAEESRMFEHKSMLEIKHTTTPLSLSNLYHEAAVYFREMVATGVVSFYEANI